MSLFKPDYEKEGKGVSKSEIDDRSGVAKFFSALFGRFWQVVILNIVYLFLCIPLVTIGPATAGLTYVMRNFSQGKPVFWFSDFIEKCREYFVKGLIIELIDICAVVLAYFAMMFWSDDTKSFAVFVRAIAIAVIFYLLYMLVCMNFYVFPMIVSFDLKLSAAIRNSLILAGKTIFRNIFMIVFNFGIALLMILFFPMSVPLILFLPFSLCSLFNNAIIYPVLVKYVAAPKEEIPVNPEEQVFTDR